MNRPVLTSAAAVALVTAAALAACEQQSPPPESPNGMAPAEPPKGTQRRDNIQPAAAGQSG